MTPILEIELNELVHYFADELEKYTDKPVDRSELNVKITALVEKYGIQIEED